MKNWQLAVAGLVGLLVGAAGVYLVWSQGSSDPGDSVAEAAFEAPVENPSSAQAPAQAQDPRARKVPAADPANARGAKRYEGGIDKLETGYDLSKVDLAAAPQEQQPPAAAADEHAHEDHTHGKDLKAEAARLAAERAAQQQKGEESWSGLLPAGKAEANKGRVALAEGEQSFDFGKLRQGELGQHEFQLVSNGEEPLVITGVKPSCGCTKADISLLAADGTRTPYTKGDPIPVGQRFVLETAINTDGRSGPFSAQVSLYGNDVRGAYNLRLTAEIEPMLVVAPSPTVFFGRMTSADQKDQAVSVTSTGGVPFKLTPNLEGLGSEIKVDFAPKDPDAEGRASEWEIKVALGPNTPIGMRNYPLRFSSDIPIPHPKYAAQDGALQTYSLMVNVQAQVTGMVSAEPSFITFGMVRPGEPVERTVRIECHDDFKLAAELPVVIEGLQGQAFPFDKAFSTSVVLLEEGRAADFKVRLEGLPDDLNGSFGGVAKIKVGHPWMDELSIRFSGVCRPGLPTTAGQAGTRPAAQPVPPAPDGGKQGGQ